MSPDVREQHRAKWKSQRPRAAQEHVKTMVMCQDYNLLESLKVTQTEFHTRQTKEADTDSRRRLWNQWAADLNKMDKMIEMRKM
jgi:hypothetical protein